MVAPRIWVRGDFWRAAEFANHHDQRLLQQAANLEGQLVRRALTEAPACLLRHDVTRTERADQAFDPAQGHDSHVRIAGQARKLEPEAGVVDLCNVDVERAVVLMIVSPQIRQFSSQLARFRK